MPGVPATTPVESGAIGAACEVPETAATTRVATAIAKTVRIIVVLLGANPEDKTLQKRSEFRAIPSHFRDRLSKFSDFNSFLLHTSLPRAR
jgi:hypothetical protein